VAESNSGNKLSGSVIVLAYVVVTIKAVKFEVVKFEISDALNAVPLSPRLELVLPVKFSSLTPAGEDAALS
jgi:hypothetical protein